MTLESVSQIAGVAAVVLGTFAGAVWAAKTKLSEAKLPKLLSGEATPTLERIEGKIDGLFEVVADRLARLETRVSRVELRVSEHDELHNDTH